MTFQVKESTGARRLHGKLSNMITSLEGVVQKTAKQDETTESHSQ